jgi:hypothetical protein
MVAKKQSTKSTSTQMTAYDKLIAEMAGEISNKVEAPSGNRIKCDSKSSKFILPDGIEADELEVVVLDFNSHNQFYESAYTPGVVSVPTCFAIGDNPKALVPSKNAPQAQSENCAQCAMNAYGSNGNGKACRNSRLLAVIDPADMAEGPVYTISVPPTSIRAWDSYVSTLVARHKCPPIGVVTSISQDSDSQYIKLKFDMKRVLVSDELKAAFDRREEGKMAINAEPDVSGFAAQQKPTRGNRRK